MCPELFPNNVVSIPGQSTYVEKLKGDGPQRNKCAKMNLKLI